MLTEAAFISLAKEHYSKIKELESIENYYDYEKNFDQLWTSYGREALEKSISETPTDRRKKKLVSLRVDRNSQYP